MKLFFANCPVRDDIWVAGIVCSKILIAKLFAKFGALIILKNLFTKSLNFYDTLVPANEEYVIIVYFWLGYRIVLETFLNG